MKYNAFLYFVLIFLLLSCTPKKEAVVEENDAEVLDFKVAQMGEVKFNHTLSFIKLETSDSCLIDKVSQIEYKRDTLFVLDGSTLKLLAFNRQGHFLQAIGRKGNGPGELIMPVSMSLNKDKSRLYVVDGGQQKVVEYDTRTLEYVREQKLSFTTSCGCLLDDGKHWVWNSQEYQSRGGDFYFHTTDENFDVENQYVGKTFKSGYVMGPSVPFYKSGGIVYGYVPHSALIYELSGDKAKPVYRVKYGNWNFPDVAYMNEISNNGISSYFTKLAESGLVSYNMLLGTNSHLLACFMVDDVKYIGFYDKRNGQSEIHPLNDFSQALKCGEFDYVASSLESDCFVFPLSSGKLKDLEVKGTMLCDDLKKVLIQASEEDNPILCMLNLK